MRQQRDCYCHAMMQVQDRRRLAAVLALGAVALGTAACGGLAHTSMTTPAGAAAPAKPAPPLETVPSRSDTGGAAGTIPTAPGSATSTTSTSAVPSARTDPSDPSGQAIPRGNIPGWHQVFTDNFAEPVPLGSFPAAVAAQWGHSYPDGWRDTSKHGTYMPTRVVSIANGVMNIHLHTEGGVHMVAAVVPTIPGAQGPGGGLLYGRFVIRIRADIVPGYKAAMVLWPDSEKWPRDGEIDFPESKLGRSIGGFVHHQGGATPIDQTEFTSSATLAQWHTAMVTWLPHQLTFELDGQIVGTTTSRVPDTPMHMILQVETQTLKPAPPSAAAGNVQIDWISVYTPACNRLMSITRAAACSR